MTLLDVPKLLINFVHSPKIVSYTPKVYYTIKPRPPPETNIHCVRTHIAPLN